MPKHIFSSRRLKLRKILCPKSITTVALAIVFSAFTFLSIFTPKPVLAWSCGDAITYAGQSYNTVLIGSQCWMAENLNVTNGNTDQSCSITRYCYGDNPSNCDTYGGLYVWADMMCGEASSNSEPSGVQGICPNGWHIPSHYEWVTLERQICSDIGNSNCDTTFPKDLTTTGWLGQDTTTAEGEGSAMAGNEPLWTNEDIDNHGAGDNDFDTSGLGALPAGYRNAGGSYIGLGISSSVWSSLESGDSAWERTLYYTYTAVTRTTNPKLYGFSVRCLKDPVGEGETVPEFTTITLIIAAVCGFGIYFIIRRTKQKAAK